MLQADFDEDLAALSVASLFYGVWPFWFLALFMQAIHPALGVIGALICSGQLASCLLGALPLTRYWMNPRVADTMFWFINVGLKIFYWAQRAARGYSPWVGLLVAIPAGIAWAYKHALLRPICFLAKLALGERKTGVVEKDVDYYGGFADWYIQQLLTKPVREMSDEELIHFSSLYGLAKIFTGK